MTIEILVEGHPEPGGSKTAFGVPNRKWKQGMSKLLRYLHDKEGRPLIQVVDANSKTKGWKRVVAKAASEQYTGPPLTWPLIVEMTFFKRRPKSHYGTGANEHVLKDSAPLYPKASPDLLKLTRPVEDALTGIVWVDDGQSVDLVLRERYCDRHKGVERVEVRVLAHAFATVGARARDAQELLPV